MQAQLQHIDNALTHITRVNSLQNKTSKDNRQTLLKKTKFQSLDSDASSLQKSIKMDDYLTKSVMYEQRKDR
jgi:hypothetical protein